MAPIRIFLKKPCASWVFGILEVICPPNATSSEWCRKTLDCLKTPLHGWTLLQIFPVSIPYELPSRSLAQQESVAVGGYLSLGSSAPNIPTSQKLLIESQPLPGTSSLGSMAQYLSDSPAAAKIPTSRRPEASNAYKPPKLESLTLAKLNTLNRNLEPRHGCANNSKLGNSPSHPLWETRAGDR